MNMTRRGEGHSAADSRLARAPAPSLVWQRGLGAVGSAWRGAEQWGPSGMAAASLRCSAELTGVSARTACRRALVGHCHMTAEPAAGVVEQGNEKKINSRHFCVYNQIYL